MLLVRLFYRGFVAVAVTPVAAIGVYFLLPIIGWWSMVLIPAGAITQLLLSGTRRRLATQSHSSSESLVQDMNGSCTRRRELVDDFDMSLDPEYHSLMGNISNDD